MQNQNTFNGSSPQFEQNRSQSQQGFMANSQARIMEGGEDRMSASAHINNQFTSYLQNAHPVQQLQNSQAQNGYEQQQSPPQAQYYSQQQTFHLHTSPSRSVLTPPDHLSTFNAYSRSPQQYPLSQSITSVTPLHQYVAVATPQQQFIPHQQADSEQTTTLGDHLANYCTESNGAKIISCTSSAQKCPPTNLLSSSRNTIWMSEEGLPQSIGIDLSKLKARPQLFKCVGFDCWHDYPTNPAVIEISVSVDGVAFITWMTLRAEQVFLSLSFPFHHSIQFPTHFFDEQRAGVQLFPIDPLNKKYSSIKFTVKETHGASKVYMNSVILLEECPSVKANKLSYTSFNANQAQIASQQQQQQQMLHQQQQQQYQQEQYQQVHRQSNSGIFSGNHQNTKSYSYQRNSPTSYYDQQQIQPLNNEDYSSIQQQMSMPSPQLSQKNLQNGGRQLYQQSHGQQRGEEFQQEDPFTSPHSSQGFQKQSQFQYDNLGYPKSESSRKRQLYQEQNRGEFDELVEVQNGNQEGMSVHPQSKKEPEVEESEPRLKEEILRLQRELLNAQLQISNLGLIVEKMQDSKDTLIEKVLLIAESLSLFKQEVGCRLDALETADPNVENILQTQPSQIESVVPVAAVPAAERKLLAEDLKSDVKEERKVLSKQKQLEERRSKKQSSEIEAVQSVLDKRLGDFEASLSKTLRSCLSEQASRFSMDSKVHSKQKQARQAIREDGETRVVQGNNTPQREKDRRVGSQQHPDSSSRVVKLLDKLQEKLNQRVNELTSQEMMLKESKSPKKQLIKRNKVDGDRESVQGKLKNSISQQISPPKRQLHQIN